MPSLRDLRRRIKSVQNTQKITKAIEIGGAARMRRAQERVLNARPYADEIRSIMAELMKRTPEYEHPYMQVREVRRRVIILVTADRGLCGALNSNNVRLAPREMNEAPGRTPGGDTGRQSRDIMRRLRKDLIADVSEIGDRPGMGTVLPATRVALEQYEKGDADQVDLVFAKFISVG